VIPGFPRHPHRGFETVTIARRGLIDHSDSMGATARFGQGDVQWMTAGKGIVHSEMFPLVHRDKNNPTELFQLWLNLPAVDKMVDPYFTMLWADTIPEHNFVDDQGKKTQISVYAGALDGVQPPKPPPNSWAARPDAAVAIWTIRLEPGAKCVLPAALAGANRVLYFFDGESMQVEGQSVKTGMGIQLRSDARVELVNGPVSSELLMLQGTPIGDPVVQHGPFVMNTRTEIHQAIQDYQRTGFGGWPWKANGPAHERDRGRFARHSDGREEQPKV